MEKSVDILILGGGINGAAAARDAALRGFSVQLYDIHDFASGASSKTSKLAHGGLRYLEHFEFRLVKESLAERELLLKNASPYVKRLPFYFPIYAHNPWPRWLIGAGLSLYDIFGHPPAHESLSAAQLQNQVPHLCPEGLKGGFIYWDALMEDARLVFENLKEAALFGAHIKNYSLPSSLHHARVIIDATGAWNTTTWGYKGTHLVIPQIHPTHAFLLITPQDRRVFFIIPWEGYSLVGTTDTPYKGDLNAVAPALEEIAYLKEAVAHYFPSADLTLISSFAGVRPLASSSLSRVPSITTTGNTITLTGGKFTTHRKVAEQVIDQAAHMLGSHAPSLTRERPLPPHFAITPEYVLQHEWAEHLTDWAFRRTPHGYTRRLDNLPLIAKTFQAYLGWDEHTLEQEMSALVKSLAN